LNFSIEFLDKSQKFHGFFQNFANVLTFSMNLDSFEHVRENPTKIHLNFDEKYHFQCRKCEVSIEYSIFNFAKMLTILKLNF